jgi:hypothetical protein
MLTATESSGPAQRLGTVAEDELLARYGAYRRRQARTLLGMVPREAVRPLYRRAVAAGFVGDGPVDPMTTILAYCETLLPLPPFDVWREDMRRHPSAHLDDIEDSAEAPGPEAPITLETRRLYYGDHAWAAHLRLFRDEGTWRGFIAFQDDSSSRTFRTTLIFQEWTAADVLDRFAGFEPATLTAFLRSALP